MRVLALIIVGMLILTSCGGEIADLSEEDDVYKIGIFEPLSGKDAEEAQAELNGIILAHKLKSTILGKPVELVYADNKSDTFNGKLAAQKLVNRKVDIILGSYGNVMSMTGGRYFADAGIPAIAISCSNPLVTKGNPYYFRVGTVDAYQAPMAASYVFNELKTDKIAIIRIAKDDFGTALAQSFSDKLKELDESLEVVSVELEKGFEDPVEILKQLKQKKIEVIYMPCSSEDALILMERADEIGFKPEFVGTNLWHNEAFLEKGGTLLEGIVFTDYFDGASSVSEETEAFISAYKENYDGEIPSPGAALAYDAYMLAISALAAKAESKAEESLLTILAKMKDFKGVTGTISFNEDGDPIKPMQLSTVENGAFKPKYIAEPEHEDKLDENPEENSE